MELKEQLGEELFNQVTAKLNGKQLFIHEASQKVIIDDGTLIPKYRLDEVIEKNKNLSAQIEQSDKDLKELKKAAVGNTDLTSQIDVLQKNSKEQKDQFEKKELEIKKSFAVKESLLNAGVGNSDARELLSHKFDIAKIEIGEDGKIKGFDEMLKPIKENKVFSGMFGETKMAGQEHQTGTNPAHKTELEIKLDAAIKNGRTAEVVAIKRQIAEQKES